MDLTSSKGQHSMVAVSGTSQQEFSRGQQVSRGQSWLFEPQSGEPRRSPAEGKFTARQKSFVPLTQAEGVAGQQEQEQAPHEGPHCGSGSLWRT